MSQYVNFCYHKKDSTAAEADNYNQKNSQLPNSK